MCDHHRVVRRGQVEVVARQWPAFHRLGVIVLEAKHPLARRRPRGARADRLDNFLDGAQIAVNLPQVHATRHARVCVRVDEAGHDRLALQVDDFRSGPRERPHLVVAAHGQKPTVRDGNRLRPRLRVGHRHDVGVI